MRRPSAIDLRGSICSAAVVVAALVAARVGMAGDDGKTLRCIGMGSVQTTRIVDDDRLLFYARSGRIYLNSLDRTCVGLQRSGKFTYEVQSGARFVRLCGSDNLTVLETTGRGFTCGLGDFVEVSAETAAELLNPRAAPGASRAISVEAVPPPDPPPPAGTPSEPTGAAAPHDR